MSNLTPGTGSFRRRLTRMVACGLVAASVAVVPIQTVHASVTPAEVQPEVPANPAGEKAAEVPAEVPTVEAAAAVPIVVWLVGNAIANWIAKRYFESRGYKCIPYAPAIMCYRYAS